MEAIDREARGQGGARRAARLRVDRHRRLVGSARPLAGEVHAVAEHGLVAADGDRVAHEVDAALVVVDGRGGALGDLPLVRGVHVVGGAVAGDLDRDARRARLGGIDHLVAERREGADGGEGRCDGGRARRGHVGVRALGLGGGVLARGQGDREEHWDLQGWKRTNQHKRRSVRQKYLGSWLNPLYF